MKGIPVTGGAQGLRRVRQAQPVPAEVRAQVRARLATESVPDVRRWLWAEHGLSVTPDAVKRIGETRG